MGVTAEMAAVPTRSVDPPDCCSDILGVRISAIDMASAVRTIESWIQSGARRYLSVCTVNTVMECKRDPALKEIVNGAGLRTPDGMPLVWLSHRAGHKQVSRVYGPDLMLELCGRSGQTGARHFFYGGAPGVVEDLVFNLKSRFPALHVAGMHTPPMLAVGQLEDPAVIQKINESRADVVWVGMGTPKQDWWVANHRPLLDAPVLIPVGAAFDFHSGRVRQAPRWMQRSGLEWAFRFTQDPKRLWRRYLIDNTEFIYGLVRQKVSGHGSHSRSVSSPY
jgi:N-acetylglucosaminyldiphosphoundecaprenol N-acetyl-beta-D-mannosaminyltransferase